MDVDQISQLPRDIAHHILSFLKNSPKALVRMNVLSKEWFVITTTFPILDFDLRVFSRDLNVSPRSDHAKNMFFKYVLSTTCRFGGNIAHTFKVRGLLVDTPWKLGRFIRLLRLVADRGVLQVYHVSINTYLPHDLYPTSAPVPDYRLPSCVTEYMIAHGSLKSLKLLCLTVVSIDERVIKLLTTSCPLLEKFKLLNCDGFKRFCINGLQKLQEVELDFKVEVERIDIDAPNLWSLSLRYWNQRGAPCMDLSSCKKLTTLSYRRNRLPNLEGSADFLSNFPYVENLYLDTLLPNLKLSSHSLKILVLHPCCNLDVTEIDAPNLVLLEYSRTNTLSQLLVKNSAKLEAQMEIFSTGDVNALWFNKLRRFLSKTTGSLKVLKLNLCSSTFIDVEELKVINSPSFELEHVEITLGSIKEFTVYIAVVDAVLWCLRPRSLTIKSDFHFLDLEHRCRVVKFTYEKLLQQKDEGRTHIQIEFSISSSKTKKHFNDLNSLLVALPRDPLRHIITLVKEDLDDAKEA